MKKNPTSLLLFLLVALMALSACGLLQEPEAASSTIEAIPLETQAAGVATSEPATTEAAEATTTPAEATVAPEATAETCLLYTSPSPRDRTRSRMPSSA